MTKRIGIYNGSLDQLDKIVVSPMSRAFLFSDSIYEVIPFHKSEFIGFQAHIERLERSAAMLDINIDINLCAQEIILLKERSQFPSGYIYYQVSRGIDQKRSHIFSGGIPETFGFAEPHKFQQSAIKVKLVPDIRWGRCDIKSTSLLGNTMQMNSADKDGCSEVIMHRDNILTEGGASNIFLVLDDVIKTPSLDQNILPGITRDLVIHTIAELDLKVMETECFVEDLKIANSIWFTSSTKGITEVESISNLETSIKKGHPIFSEVSKRYIEKFLT